jgi:nucleoid DNA-binding protein
VIAPPIAACLACGGTYFREATFHEFLPETLEYLTLAWDCEPGQISRMPMTILICLCGSPLRPRLSGMRWGYTPNRELGQFFESVDCAERYERLRHDPAPPEQEVAQELVAKDRLLELRLVAAGLEKQIGRLLAPRDEHHIKPGGHWRQPQRKPPTKAKGRDWLVVELQKSGLTFDEARAAVSAIFDSITTSLKRGEPVETPLGEFRFAKRTKPYARFRLGKLQMLHRKHHRVAFQPHPEWMVRSQESKR